LVIFIALSSCDRIFQFGGEQELDGFGNQLDDPRLVIEAYINDMDTVQMVRLSKTLPLKSDEPIELVEDATIKVTTNGITYEYQYVDSLNSFAAKFTGEPDVNYQLEIDYQGKTYRSSAVMANLQQFEIDSIEIRKGIYDFSHFRYFDPDAPFRDLDGEEILITKDENYEIQDTLLGNKAIVHNVIYLDPEDNTYLEDYKYGDLAEFWFSPQPYIINAAQEGEVMNVYKIYLYAKESQIDQNYYRFDIKRFGRSWLQPGQIIVANDFAIGENISGIEFPGFFVVGDEVEFSMYGISLEAYNFYTSLQNTINNDGGGFSPPPGNPVTNIFDEDGKPALGFFEVAKVARVTKIVQGE
jgi:hypothetical protein